MPDRADLPTDDQRIIDLQKRAGFWLKVSGPFIIIALLFLFAYEAVVGVLTPFVAAFILAYILDPIVTFIEKRCRVSRVLGVTILYIAILLILFLFLTLVGIRMVQETGQFVEKFQSVYWPNIATWFSANFHSVIENIPEPALEAWSNAVAVLQTEIAQVSNPEHLRELLEKARTVASSDEFRSGTSFAARGLGAFFYGIALVAGWLVGLILSVLGALSGATTLLSLSLIIAFYILVSFSEFKRRAAMLYPAAYREEVGVIMRKIDIQLSSYLRGQLTIAITVGVLSSIGLSIVGVPYAIIIGLFAGLANIIPYLGPIVGATPAILVTILEFYPDWTGAILIRSLSIVAVFAVIQTLDGFLISPRVMGKALDMNPMIILFALLLGGALMGFLGMLVAVPVLCVVRVLVNEIYLRRTKESEAAAGAGPSPPEEPAGQSA